MSTGKVLLGVLAGIAAGATLGILFAPDSGSTTRKRIYKKGDDYVDELGNKYNEIIDGVTRQFKTVRERTATIVENGKTKVGGVMDEAMTYVK